MRWQLARLAAGLPLALLLRLQGRLLLLDLRAQRPQLPARAAPAAPAARVELARRWHGRPKWLRWLPLPLRAVSQAPLRQLGLHSRLHSLLRASLP